MWLIYNETYGHQAKLNFHTSSQMFKSKCDKKSALDLFPKKRKVDSTISIVKYCQMKIKEKEESQKPCRKKVVSNVDRLKYTGPSKPLESGKENPLTGCFKACKQSKKSEDPACSNKVEEKPKEQPKIRSSKQPICRNSLDRLSKEIQEIMARRIKVEEQKKKPELDKREKDFCKETSSSPIQMKEDDECLRRDVTAETTLRKSDVTDKNQPKESVKEKCLLQKAPQTTIKKTDECKELKSKKPTAAQCPEDSKTTKSNKACEKKDSKCLKTSEVKNGQDLHKLSASTNSTKKNECKSDSHQKIEQSKSSHCDNIASKKIEGKKCEKLIATLAAGPQSQGLCQSRDDKEEVPAEVIAKDCKCDVTPAAKAPEKDECQPKPLMANNQTIQKGLKGLTNMLPGSETNELKDMGLLRQCMLLAKENQRTPVTLRKFGNTACIFFVTVYCYSRH